MSLARHPSRTFGRGSKAPWAAIWLTGLCLPILLGLVGPVWAETGPAETGPAETGPAVADGYSLTGAALKMVGVLALVLGILGVALYVIRRISPTAGRLAGARGEFTLLAQYQLGPKKMMALVKVGQQALLLGVTDSNINLLTEIDDPELIDRLEGPEIRAGNGFSSVLSRIRKPSGTGEKA